MCQKIILDSLAELKKVFFDVKLLLRIKIITSNNYIRDTICL